jgi:type IV pilus assembly protein PilW
MNKQKGLTLIELMIAMVIGLLIVGTVITIFITNVRSNRDNVAMIKLNQELRGAMTFISDELKRSGYNDGLYEAYLAELEINDADTPPDYISDDDCIRYAYQAPSVSAASVVPPTSIYGFRFDTGAKEIKWGANATDACNFGESITDKNLVEITNFDIKLLPVEFSSAGDVMQVEVTIEGNIELSGNITATRNISEIIRVRNDRI